MVRNYEGLDFNLGLSTLTEGVGQGSKAPTFPPACCTVTS